MEEPVLEYYTASDAETEAVGAELAGLLRPGDFVAMYGDLGAGKTALVRGMASLLAPDAAVCSPTYTIVNEYPSARSGGVFRHMDLYRIRDEEDLFSIGFYDFLGEGILAAEWCERIPYALPASYYRVSIEKTDAHSRHITVTKVGGTQ